MVENSVIALNIAGILAKVSQRLSMPDHPKHNVEYN